jgi:hypothetical protein
MRDAGSLLQPAKEVKAGLNWRFRQGRHRHNFRVTSERGKYPIFNKLLDYFGGSIGLSIDCYARFSRL